MSYKSRFSKSLTIALEPNIYDIIKETADHNDVSLAEVIRLYIDTYLEEENQHPDQQTTKNTAQEPMVAA